ncbi:PLDc N-terminal domain-containing protein [Stutzerimonas balearica]|uniref:PLDc N-terminal domain-containing protein n=1 Tax=Stutzerimonas balearica TaxID=74829 RepID=A0A9X7V968_9GAMM|nr:PLDc N-terminal domain-containing protein [Stutzerimonas balearica]QQN51537.1 PLDc N-terminal domain-containing protein [Stutzerimonas balearica]
MSDTTTYLAIAGAVLVIVLDLLAVISVFKSERSVGSKAIWALGIALFPLLGLLFWLIVGVRRLR